MQKLSLNLEKDFTFFTEGGSLSIDTKDNLLAIAVSKASPRGERNDEEGGHAYVVTKKGKVIMSWRFDSQKGFNCAAFKPDSDVVIFGNDDGSLYVFKTDGEMIKKVDLDAAIYSCAFSPSGSFVALGTEGGKVSVRDSSFEPLWEYLAEDNVWGLSWSPDERYVAVASHDGHLYVLTKPKEVWKDDLGAPVNKAKWCGNYLAASTWEGLVVTYDASDPQSPSKLWEGRLGSNVWGLDFDDACSYLAAGSRGSDLVIFDTEGNMTLSVKPGPVDDLSWRGPSLAVASKNKVEVFKTMSCVPYILPTLKRFKAASFSKPENIDFIEMSKLFYALLGRPKKVKVNGETYWVKVIDGDFLYIFSQHDGEVEVEIVDEG
ncbi:WD40 repeat domain-containing protein [Ignicoccus hospitalis]|uniref:WD-40 repeat protein n=1 Tax=Ignicoccus hospitalis (strain KIN4/I / DSM 18386 / JCM 14125) TaxID=453591 RepID=A8A9Z1_IGNH4|nr:hypothetical protein [Ignicoccus hospitalis]ABU81743.1 WD-40 repeat protein [Ignicoccus hospitalis KIN4/I]HIH90008.1 hypothetical protein [Desulfurococcaceae archaeon]